MTTDDSLGMFLATVEAKDAKIDELLDYIYRLENEIQSLKEQLSETTT